MLRFVDCTSALLPAVREFWVLAYGEQHVLGTDQTLFDWQFSPAAGDPVAQNDSPDRYHMKLVMNDDKVVACLGFIPTQVIARGRTLRACWLANWKVLPETARLGLGPLLLREVLREVDIVMNVGVSKEAKPLLVRMGWLDLGTLYRWVRVLQPQRADLLLADEAQGEWPSNKTVSPVSGRYTLSEIDSFDGSAGELWDDVWGTSGTGTRRSAKLLNWRYAKHPSFHYHLLELREGKSLAGFAVYRVEPVQQPALQVARIVELVARPEAASALISGTCDHAATKDVALIDFFCASSRLGDSLESTGFQRSDTGRAQYMPHRFQPVDRRRSKIACMVYTASAGLVDADGDWYATKGDADQDRPN